MPTTIFQNTAPLNTNCWLGLDLGSTSIKAVAVTPADATRAKFPESFALATAAWDGPISHRHRVPIGTLPLLARRRR